MEAREADCNIKSPGDHTHQPAKNDLIEGCICCLPNGRKGKIGGTCIFNVVTKGLCLKETVINEFLIRRSNTEYIF